MKGGFSDQGQAPPTEAKDRCGVNLHLSPAFAGSGASCCCRELFRNAGSAHAFIDAFPPRQVDRVIAARAGAEAADREARLHDQSRLCSGARRLDPPEVRQRRGERQMREREIAIDINGAAKPRDRFIILPEMQLGGAGAAGSSASLPLSGGLVVP